MNPRTSLITLSLLASAATAGFAEQPNDAQSPQEADMIRFANNDTLHGSFLSFDSKDNLKWQNPESKDAITFATKKIHRITLNRGRAYKAMQYQSAVQLINGDVIPAQIISADQKVVKISTEHLGDIEIPREHIAQLSTTPFGGKLLYYGPLNEDGWTTVKSKAKLKKKVAAKIDKEAKADDNADAPPADEPKPRSHWEYIANAWYSGLEKTDYLVREDALPDQCKISFKLAWRNSNLYTNVILHADFDPPEYTGDENKPQTSNSTCGRAYILSLNAHNATMTSVTFDENGSPSINRFNTTRASMSLAGKTEADIEIRLDKTNKSILLFSDGSFRGKWSFGDQYDGKGNHLAFRNMNYNNSEIRISDIAISHWNGMKDSAQSMTSTKRDVILLNNGVDRFSGTFKHLKNGQTSFVGAFDNDMTIPTEDIQEIHFATQGLKPFEDSPNDALHFFVYPYGRITGTPVSSANGKTKLSTLLLGDIDLDLRYINIIDFSQSNSLLDLWDDNF